MEEKLLRENNGEENYCGKIMKKERDRKKEYKIVGGGGAGGWGQIMKEERDRKKEYSKVISTSSSFNRLTFFFFPNLKWTVKI